MTLSFTVYGKAEGQGSGRAVISKSTGRAIYLHDNDNVVAWRREIAITARCEMSMARVAICSGAVSVRAVFHLPRPKRLRIPKYAHVDVPHTTTPDLDKLMRALGDALSGVVYQDDSQVTNLALQKQYVGSGEQARIEVSIHNEP